MNALLSLILTMLLHSSTANDRVREILFDLSHSKRLALPNDAGHKSAKIDVQGQMDCVFACTVESWCRSMNFKTTPKSDGLFGCQLLSIDRIAGAEFMISDINYNYFTVENPCSKSTCPITMTNCTMAENRIDIQCKCRTDVFDGENCDKCKTAVALGLESKAIPDLALTASSVYEFGLNAQRARLNTVKLNATILGAWAPEESTLGQWLQVDLGAVTMVTAIATQGREDFEEWVTGYTLQYSTEVSSFLEYENGKVFVGNNDQNTTTKNDISPSIIARYIRVFPKTYHKYMCLRLELYGCK